MQLPLYNPTSSNVYGGTIQDSTCAKLHCTVHVATCTIFSQKYFQLVQNNVCFSVKTKSRH